MQSSSDAPAGRIAARLTRLALPGKGEMGPRPGAEPKVRAGFIDAPEIGPVADAGAMYDAVRNMRGIVERDDYALGCHCPGDF